MIHLLPVPAACKILEEFDKQDIAEVAKSFEAYSGQTIPESIVSTFRFSGLSNTDFLMSDFLNKFGLKNITQVVIERNPLQPPPERPPSTPDKFY